MGYVFISYSTQQQEEADSVRQILIDERIDCWMAPYDIPAGSRYAAVIENAIKGCACFLLLFSEAAQASVFVCKEVERAVSHRKTVIPMKIEDVEMNEEFLFYLSNQQSIRVTDVDKNDLGLKKILRALRQHTDSPSATPQQTQQPAPSQTPTEQPAPRQTRQAPAQTQQPIPEPPQTRRSKPSASDLPSIIEECKNLIAGGNYEEAEEILISAVDTGDAEAQYLLGKCYQYGGSIQNISQAIKWYTDSARQSFPVAQYALGCCYYYGYGVDVDYNEAIIWFRMAEKDDDAGSKFMLGMCYYTGNGFEQDYDEALRWFRRAASDDFAEAQNAVGECYYNGYGTLQDRPKAWRWFDEAAERGSAKAMFNLGVMYENGQYVSTDMEKALEMYRKSANLGCEEAKQALVRLNDTPAPTARAATATARAATATARAQRPTTSNNQGQEFQISNGVLVKYNGQSSNVEIPEGVTAIGRGAFERNSVISNVFIPASVETIGEEAFLGCTNLERFTIAKRCNLTNIEQLALSQCIKLREITIPRTVKRIAMCAFESCNSLAEVNFQNGEDWSCWTIDRHSRREEKSFPESEIRSSENAAKLLTGAYCNYTWEKK